MTLQDQASKPFQGPALRSVTVPLLQSDLASNLPDLLDLWCDPRFFPLTETTLRHDAANRVLNIVINRAAPGDEDRLHALFAEKTALHGCFSRILVTDAGLEGDRDLYVRGRHDAAGQFGNKAGPNFLFETAMRSAAQFGGFTAQLEIDCLPLTAGWLDELELVTRSNSRAWVIGSTFSGNAGLDKSIQPHLNGNAIYCVGDPRFQEFLTRHWMQGLLDRVPTNPNLAYDCWWAFVLQRANPLAGNADWDLVRLYDGQFRNDPFLVNFLGRGAALTDAITECRLRAAIGRRPVLLHGGAMIEATRALLQDRMASVLDVLADIAGAERDLGGHAAILAADCSWPPRPQATAASGDGDLAAAAALIALSGRLLLGADTATALAEWGGAARFVDLRSKAPDAAAHLARVLGQAYARQGLTLPIELALAQNAV